MHYTFEKLWIDQMKKDKMYLWLILDSFVSASHSRDVDDWIARAPEMSLRTQGWLDKASCPILAINGARDTWITIEDIERLI